MVDNCLKPNELKMINDQIVLFGEEITETKDPVLDLNSNGLNLYLLT